MFDVVAWNLELPLSSTRTTHVHPEDLRTLS